MSLTALMWFALYCSSAVLAFVVNPLFGALGYLLEYYQRPELKWWGDDLPALRWNLIISIVLGVSFLVRRASLRELLATPNPALRWLLGLGTVMVFVSLTVAVNKEMSWDWMVQWWKMAFIFPLLIVGVVRTRGAFNVFILAHMLGALWWGWDAWNDPERAQGRLLTIGSGDTLNDNAASAHLLTVVPFILVYLLTETDKRLRAVALVALPFVVNTIILCNSRGSMVGAGVALASSIVLIRRGYRTRLVGVGVGVVATLFLLADQTFIDRQQTTSNYEEDGSAQGRLVTWRGGYELLKDRPLGAGGRGFHLLSPIYIPEVVAEHGGDLRAPHNTYVMVTTEWGILGLICFIGLYASAFLMAHRIKKRATPQEQSFYYWRAFAIQIGLIGYLVAGVFTDRLYAEAGYWTIALCYSLYRMQATEQAEQPTQVTATVESEAAWTVPSWPLADVGAR